MESMQASRHMSSSQHQHDEAVREVEQVRHTNETLHQENPSSTYRAQTEASNIRIVTPNYKTGEKPSSDLKTGVDVADLNAKFSETNGDYKAERSQEHFRMQIIDPKVNSNAHLPAHAPREYARKKLMEDFPSLHGKRSFLNLQQSRPPITTSLYLTESVDRHRDMQASELAKYLKAREEEANKPWNKPGWPGPKDMGNTFKSSMWRTKSLGDLRAADLPDKLLLRQGRAAATNTTQQQDKVDQQVLNNEEREEQILGDPGYLVKVRKNKYLSKAARSHSTVCCCKPHGNCQRLRLIQRTRSESELQHKPAWHPRKIFVCEQVKEQFARETKVTSEQQPSSAVANNLPTLSRLNTHSNATPQHIHHQQPSAVRPRRPPRLSTNTTKPYRQQTQSSVQQSSAFIDRKAHQKKPISFQSATLFHSPVSHSLNQHIYVNTSQENTSTDIPTVSIPSTRLRMTSPGGQPVRAYNSQIPPPPPPPPPPKSILKQNYEYKQEFMDGAQYWQDNAEFAHSNRGGHRSLLDNPEYQKQMAENLQALRPRMEGSQQQQQPQAVPFNGPFFRLEEVESVRSGPSDLQVNLQRQHRYQEESMRPRSSSSVEQSSNRPDLSRTEELDDEGVVVIWPPLDYNNKKRPTSTPVTRNMRDPETLQEFQRQKQLEMEAIRQNEEREMRLREKQFQAAKVQQEQLLQHLKETNEYVPNESMSLYQSCSSTTGGQPGVRRCGQAPLSDPGQQSSPNLRVFEARPISAFSGDSGLPIDATFSTLGSASPSWKRTYTVDNTKQGEKLRNEILTSDEVLEKERFEIDLLKRREVFVEKVKTPPEINRLGRRWQAPPEKPYVWPTLRRPVTIQTPSNEPAFTTQTNYHMVDHQEGYEWFPVVKDPDYKKERNNFTPTHSPPEPSRSGTLDEVAKRQTRNVIKPSPDGSHRPTPAFRHGRQTPSGGFYPHAPNSIKVIKKRNVHICNNHSPRSNLTVNQDGSDVQIVHKVDYHATGLPSPHSTQNSPGQFKKILKPKKPR